MFSARCQEVFTVLVIPYYSWEIIDCMNEELIAAWSPEPMPARSGSCQYPAEEFTAEILEALEVLGAQETELQWRNRAKERLAIASLLSITDQQTKIMDAVRALSPFPPSSIKTIICDGEPGFAKRRNIEHCGVYFVDARQMVFESERTEFSLLPERNSDIFDSQGTD